VKATAAADNPPATASCDARSDTSNESRADGGKSDDGDGDGNDNSEKQATELPEAVPAATIVDAKAAPKILTSTAQLPTTAPASPAATPSLAPQQAPTSGKRYWTPLLDQNNLRYSIQEVTRNVSVAPQPPRAQVRVKRGQALPGWRSILDSVASRPPTLTSRLLQRSRPPTTRGSHPAACPPIA
jgi:hypothetical protein